eukprot:NODE_1601_length_798_cov_86.916542_g1552_i0.p1 GENE.NODE_1601_length_798_cov_86.916542_g1552_i0~~NODE_1601_length_798_cov_86.916542_g1552_i0.p1  ORF type:complete len:250 (-),score=44.95 NODE_1601_length_798_cov_86.916542_g1552_i0:49-696(-)
MADSAGVEHPDMASTLPATFDDTPYLRMLRSQVQRQHELLKDAQRTRRLVVKDARRRYFHLAESNKLRTAVDSLDLGRDIVTPELSETVEHNNKRVARVSSIANAPKSSKQRKQSQRKALMAVLQGKPVTDEVKRAATGQDPSRDPASPGSLIRIASIRKPPPGAKINDSISDSDSELRFPGADSGSDVEEVTSSFAPVPPPKGDKQNAAPRRLP